METGKTGNKKMLLRQQDVVLIKNSNEAKDSSIYGNLFDCLESYKKLSNSELNKNLVFDDKARAVLLNWENKESLINNIMKEWFAITNYKISDTKIPCQLCGTPNIIICFIQNKITGVELHIGSDCIKSFSDIDGLKQQRKNIMNLHRERDRQKRKIEFEILEGDDIGFLAEAKEKNKNFKVLLPYKLQLDINDNLNQINLVKESYIKSGGDINRLFSVYSSLKNKFNKLYNNAELHYYSVKDDLRVCDKDTSEWLLKNNPHIREKVSKNNGLFDVETLKKVTSEEYVKKKLDIFRKHLSDSDIRIIHTNGSNISFLIQNNRYIRPVIFSMRIKDFMETIGCYCLTNKKFTFDKSNFNNILIDNTYKNYFAVYNSIKKILINNGYDFIFEEKTQQGYWKKLPYNEKRTRWSDVITYDAIYKKSDTSLLLSTFSLFLLKDETVFEKNFDKVINKMECGKTWITQHEKESREQITKEARGLQRQGEFIPYI